MSDRRVLVVEDDDLMQDMIKGELTRQGYRFDIASDGLAGLAQFQKHGYELVLTDLKLPKMDGLSLLKKIRESAPETVVIMMTAYGSVETAVEAMRMGAFDYITKPFLAEELVMQMEKALQWRDIQQENRLLREELDQRYRLGNIIGKSRQMRDIYSLIERIADSRATVMIQGESGTGKELIAEAVHHASQRRDKPLIKVSCAALTETLLESELFGHERGAFTDAVKARKGRFELAHQGSLFLDDIDDINISVQTKLLRVLQEREFEKVGGSEVIKVDVRLIAATKTDLKKEVEKGTFREDLYYRLNVVPIPVPPLREHKEDIPALVNHFLDRLCKENGRKLLALAAETLQPMMAYNWPGNVRELENLVERMVAMSAGDTILPTDLPDYIREPKKWQPTTLKNAVREHERDHILRVLESVGFKKQKAAAVLGISAKTLWEKLKQYDMPES